MMTTTIDNLKAHCSIRKFSEQSIDRATLEELIRCGQHASTSSFIQATTVIRVSQDELRQAFAELSGNQKYVANAAEFLVFCADLNRNRERSFAVGGLPDYGWTEQFLAASIDVALFAQNVVVAAESLGLGACYIGGIRNDPERVSSLLSLPKLVYPVFGLCLGYPDQEPEPKPRLPLDLVLHQNQYQAPAESEREFERYDDRVRQYYQRRSKGKLDFSWSQQMNTQAERQTRPFMKRYLEEKGFNIK